MFLDFEIDLEKELYKTCIQQFENNCQADPISELTTAEWLKRCEFPLGMSDNGDLFELE